MSAPDVATVKFAANVVIPLAQVTVVDGIQGDCNIVDFCRLPLPPAGADKATIAAFNNYSWRRTIIDTGIGMHGAIAGTPNPRICSTLKLLAGQLTLPVMPSDKGQGVVPKVDTLQITHSDNDHIGNAAGFLRAMCVADPVYPKSGDTTRYLDRISGCTVIYCAYPPFYNQAIVQPSKPSFTTYEYKKVPVDVNAVTFTATLDPEWAQQMTFAGFTPIVKVKACDANGVAVTRENQGDFGVIDYAWSAPVGDTSSCTIRYKQSVSQNKTTVYVYSSISFTLDNDKSMKASMVGASTTNFSVQEVSIPVGTYKPEIQLEADVQAKFKRVFLFQLDWVDGVLPGKAKMVDSMANYQRTGKESLPRLMSNMVLRRPPVNFQATVAPIVGSIAQIFSLTNTIRTVNALKILSADKKSTSTPGIITSTPKTGYVYSAYPDADPFRRYGFHRLLGPSPHLYGQLMRRLLLAEYLKGSARGANVDVLDLPLDGDTINRASIVTMFERPRNLDDVLDSEFSMLFTGDAYDKACDIRDTLMSWKPGFRVMKTIFPKIQVDVLKVPHHGSDVTQTSGFYTYVRAQTYIISGDFHDGNGNPKLSTLKAIVKGFYQEKVVGDQPFRLFFSSVRANVNYPDPPVKNEDPVWRSPVILLNNSELKATPATGDYYYEMYMLKQQAGYSKEFVAFGSLTFGKDGGKDGTANVLVNWDPSQWSKIS